MSAALNSLGIVKAIFTLCRQTVLEALWWSCSELKGFFERKKEVFFFVSCFEETTLDQLGLNEMCSVKTYEEHVLHVQCCLTTPIDLFIYLFNFRKRQKGQYISMNVFHKCKYARL